MVNALRFGLSLVFIFSVIVAQAQDLTGIWRGHFKSDNQSKLLDSLQIEDRYKFETQIEQKNKAFQGVTYSYKTTVFYGKASCVGTVSSKTRKVILGENSLLEVKSSGGGACLMTCFLQYSKVGNEEFLEGTYTSISVRDSMQCGGGTVFLRKVNNSDFYKEPFLVEREKQEKKEAPIAKINPPNSQKKEQPSISKTPEKKPQPGTPTPLAKKTVPKKSSDAASSKLKATEQPKKTSELKQLPLDTVRNHAPSVAVPVPRPRVLTTRKNELVKTITSSAKQVSINIYDNGTIDNDTVSVYVDNRLVISRQRLTEKPITLTINLDDGAEFHELVMVAENLGEIPPNTSLMVVTAGEEKHEVRITSTEQKNAVVRFRAE